MGRNCRKILGYGQICDLQGFRCVFKGFRVIKLMGEGYEKKLKFGVFPWD